MDEEISRFFERIQTNFNNYINRDRVVAIANRNPSNGIIRAGRHLLLNRNLIPPLYMRFTYQLLTIIPPWLFFFTKYFLIRIIDLLYIYVCIVAVKIIAFTHQLNTSILHFPSFKIPFHCRPNKNGTRLKSISLENRIISFFICL